MEDAVLVTSYINLDLDGYSCAFAYAELLNKQGVAAKAGIGGEPHLEARWVINTFGIPELEQRNPEEYEKIILVDCSDTVSIDSRIDPQQVVEIIDHRAITEVEKFPNAKTQIELVGACATLVAERFQKAHIQPSKEAAILLHAAIISNTGNFLYSVTQTRDKDAVAWLHERSHLPDDFGLELFAAKSDLRGERLQEALLGDMAVKTFAGKQIAAMQLEILDAESLLKERFDEILHIMRAVKRETNYDYLFLSLVSIGGGYNILITEDAQAILTQALNVTFSQHIARTKTIFMRKQLAPLLKAALEQ